MKRSRKSACVFISGPSPAPITPVSISTSESRSGEPAQKGDVPRRIGRTKGGLNSKLHTVCDGEGRPIILLLSEGQMSDHKGARLVLGALPSATHLIADRGYDSAWFREELEVRGIEPCIPSSRSRKTPFAYDKALYRQRHKVENLFAKLKDWRRIATRYDRCAHTFFSAICIAAAVIFWL
jgi:putative transposase